MPLNHARRAADRIPQFSSSRGAKKAPSAGSRRHGWSVRPRGAALWLCAIALVPAPAAAALKLCNQTSYILEIATGVARAEAIITKGWIRLIPGACKAVLAGDLRQQTSFVYAHSARAYDGPRKAWGGLHWLCARTGDFRVVEPSGDTSCTNGQRLPFFRISAPGQENWTQTFAQTPALASRTAAQSAGLARLLTSAGLDGAHPTQALARFRARMHIPVHAPLRAVFDALESAALSKATPNGYEVCNDTAAPVFVALANREGGHWHTRGWWHVGPVACAQTVSTPLKGTVYLLVDGTKGHRLVGGSAQFCVTNITFDVEGKGSCATRGLKPAGFLATNRRHRAGYIAHVDQNGLIPAPK